MVPTGQEKKRFVQKKFAAVTRRYDLLNSLLSFYTDHYWRWKAARELRPYKKGPILDLCAGTLPLSEEIVRQGKRPVVALDFCLEMLEYGKEKVLQKPGKKDFIRPVCGDAERLPVTDDTFEGITIAFGIRNLSRPDIGLREMKRVLVKGGKLVILEFSRPKNPLFAPFYRFYLHKVLPFIAGTISGDKEAYDYLAASIQKFYEPEQLAAMMKEAGFTDVRYQPLTFGIVTIYTGLKA